MKKKLLLLAALLALALGVWQLGGGGYLYLKAQLAQVLLERSWAAARAGRKEARPWPWADTRALMRLRAPRLGINQIVLAGASRRVLAFGPGFMLASFAPGEGTTVISGHRETHFAFLPRLHKGDLLLLQTADGRLHRYRVSRGEVVDTRSSRLLLRRGRDELLLVTCYPFGPGPLGPLRYVLHAQAERQPLLTRSVSNKDP